MFDKKLVSRLKPTKIKPWTVTFSFKCRYIYLRGLAFVTHMAINTGWWMVLGHQQVLLLLTELGMPSIKLVWLWWFRTSFYWLCDVIQYEIPQHLKCWHVIYNLHQCAVNGQYWRSCTGFCNIRRDFSLTQDLRDVPQYYYSIQDHDTWELCDVSRNILYMKSTIDVIISSHCNKRDNIVGPIAKQRYPVWDCMPNKVWKYGLISTGISRVSCQKGPTRHAYAWQTGPFWQDTLDIVPSLLLTL